MSDVEIGLLIGFNRCGMGEGESELVQGIRYARHGSMAGHGTLVLWCLRRLFVRNDMRLPQHSIALLLAPVYKNDTVRAKTLTQLGTRCFFDESYTPSR